MITTISKQSGRRYPQSRSSTVPAAWLPSVGTTTVIVIGATPATRMALVPVEIRSAAIAADVRTRLVPVDDRRATVK